jgi:hypothetical protein
MKARLPTRCLTPFGELRWALEVQQGAIADRLEAVRQAEAALAHLHDVLAVPFLPLPGLTEDVQAPRDALGRPRHPGIVVKRPVRPPGAAGGVPRGGARRARTRGGRSGPFPVPADPVVAVLEPRRDRGKVCSNAVGPSSSSAGGVVGKSSATAAGCVGNGRT